MTANNNFECWFDCHEQKICPKAKEIISRFFWYLELPKWAKLDQVKRLVVNFSFWNDYFWAKIQLQKN